MTEQSIRSVCPYCGVGCGIVLQVRDGQVAKVTGDKLHPSNRGRLCTKGTTCHQPLRDSGRMAHAYQRKDRATEPVRADMAQTLAATGQRLRRIRDEHGPDAIALYVSGQMSLEAQYLANKLAKGYIGTNQIESNSRLCMASASSGYKLSLGADGPPGSYEDFDKADVFLVIGANMADCHPILFLRMMDRVKAGAKLIVVDPRRNATADKADLFLQIDPGTDLALLNGLLHLLRRNGHTDAAFIEAFTEGWDVLPDFLAAYTPEAVARLTGLSAADIERAARWIGEAENWMSCWTMGLNQSTHGTWNTNALCNLHLATGKICQPGSGPFSLTGQPNAMGGREMGYMGPGLPGQRSVLVAQDRAFVERAWGVPDGTLHTRLGAGTVGLFQDMAAGKVKACWIICTNPVASVANRSKVIEGLQAAELVIAQDAYLDTETNRHADVLLPAALWAEADGVMINSERNLTLARQAVEPPGEAMADWQIIAEVACAMGYAEAFSYTSAAQVFEEIKGFNNSQTGYDLRGASHARLRHTPLQWPCAEEAGDGRAPIRYLAPEGAAARLAFATPSGKAQFFARPHMDPAEMPDAQYPFVLNTGRLQHQWHTLTKTGKVATLNKLNPGPFIEVHPDDAQRLEVRDKDCLEIRSRRGRAVLPVVVTDRVRPGGCFAPFHWNDLYGEHLAINAVTHDAVDPISQQPEFKFCAVSLSRVELLDHQFLETRVAQQAPVHCAPVTSGPGTAVTLLWASQTGNAEALAGAFAERLGGAGCSVELAAMDSYPTHRLDSAQHLVLFSSTFGDGDPPDNGQAFWKALSTGAPPLGHLRYAVLALGDPSYDQFCQHGKNLDRRLAELGAQRMGTRLDCEPDQQDTAQQWLAALLAELSGVPASAEPSAPPEPTGSSAVSRERPAALRLIRSTRLNGEGASKDTRQVVFSLGDTGLAYEAGDALGVWPRNCPGLVEELLGHGRLDPGQVVSVPKAGDMPLHVALTDHYEICRPTPQVLALVAERSGQAELRRLLDSGDAELKRWLWGRQLADVLAQFPAQHQAQALLATLKPLQPRLYSIASSARAHAGELHLTVSTVRYGRRKGVASTYLADRAVDAQVRAFVQPSRHFRVPDQGDQPIVMIGPGTGVAPFRGFLHERRARGDTGRNWLFFGEQHAATDYYYRDELEAMHADGLLTHLSLAFSRDQAEKVYVQDRMREHGAELWRWLEEGACLYVCGDASRMAKDVERTLCDLASLHGGLDEDRAQAYVRALAEHKRYLRDVY